MRLVYTILGGRMKKNCWEVKSCGREEKGVRVGDMGVCPAALDKRLHGVHGGKNAGRSCWVLAGTMCGGRVQGTFAQKYETCAACEFYKKVRDEENGSYEMSIVLLGRLKKTA